MPLSCDHKTIFDGNMGPNTGGMGVFSPPGWLDSNRAAIDEAFNTFVVPNMFARAAKGEMSAEDSAKQAEADMKRIFAKWNK